LGSPFLENITKLYNSNAAGFTLSTLPEDVKYVKEGRGQEGTRKEKVEEGGKRVEECTHLARYGLSEMWTLEVAPHRVIAGLYLFFPLSPITSTQQSLQI
jgi:hypothetical protein